MQKAGRWIEDEQYDGAREGPGPSLFQPVTELCTLCAKTLPGKGLPVNRTKNPKTGLGLDLA